MQKIDKKLSLALTFQKFRFNKYVFYGDRFDLSRITSRLVTFLYGLLDLLSIPFVLLVLIYDCIPRLYIFKGTDAEFEEALSVHEHQTKVVDKLFNSTK